MRLLHHRAPRGSHAFARSILQAAAAETRSDTASELVEPLTDREREILDYLPTRLSNTEIAAHLYVSVNTLKSHLRHIYTKLAGHQPRRGRRPGNRPRPPLRQPGTESVRQPDKQLRRRPPIRGDASQDHPSRAMCDRGGRSYGPKAHPEWPRREGWPVSSRYEIVVAGDVGPTVLGALTGFELQSSPAGTSRLVGTVPDPAALQGTLQPAHRPARRAHRAPPPARLSQITRRG